MVEWTTPRYTMAMRASFLPLNSPILRQFAISVTILLFQIGLSSTTIASSFGKAISDNKEIEDYNPEDIARSLLRMISNNIGQVSCFTFCL